MTMPTSAQNPVMTASNLGDGVGAHEPAADRAMVARRILAENGLPHDRFHSVIGRADADPLFPEDPFLASNRRISILIMTEAPPLPVNHKPQRAWRGR